MSDGGHSLFIGRGMSANLAGQAFNEETMGTTQASVHTSNTQQDHQQAPLQTLVLHNADDVSFQQVWMVLARVFDFSNDDVVKIANEAHGKGKTDLFTATREVIEAKLALCVETSKAEGCPQLPFSVRDS